MFWIGVVLFHTPTFTKLVQGMNLCKNHRSRTRGVNVLESR